MSYDSILKSIFSFVLTAITFIACNDEIEETNLYEGKRLSFNVGVNQVNSRAIITGDKLVDGDQIGVTLVDETGISYQLKNYNNICFTASNVDGNQKWQGSEDIFVNDVVGTLYAYYPYKESVNITAMEIETESKTDYLYATPVTDVSQDNASINIVLKHAMANVSLKFIGDGYSGEGSVTSVSINSEAFATEGLFNTLTGTYNSIGGKNETLTDETSLLLNEDKSNIMVVPTGDEAAIEILVTIDGKNFKAKTKPIAVESGYSYIFNLYVNDTKAVLSDVQVTQWLNVEDDEKLMVEKVDDFDNAVILQYYVDEASLASSPTGVEMNIFSSHSSFNIADVDRVSIDGVEVTPSLKHTFTTPGYHNVKVLLKDIESVPPYMFFDLDNLLSVHIPSTVNSISTSAFQDCSFINTISVDEDNVTFNSKDNCNAIVRTVDNVLFLGCKNTVIPNDVVGIGIYAFYGCADLSNIIIPESVTEYAEYAFSHAKNFHPSITNNLSVVKMGDYAFLQCRFNEPVVFSDVLEEVGNEIFSDCTGTRAVVFGTGIKKVGRYLFGNSGGTINFKGMVQPVIDVQDKSWGTTYFVIPDGAISGYWDGFKNNNGFSNFRNIREENSFEEDGFLYSADKKTIISYSGNASSLSIPEGVEQLYSQVFYDKENLVYVQFPGSLKRIGRLAFGSTGLMGEITIPNSVTTIDAWAFNTCKDLTVINLGANLETIGDYVFIDCTALTKVIIPNGVKNIGSGAFCNCSLLSEFTIPGSLTTIEGETFVGCDGLTDITIPSNVTSIGERAFSGCDGLTNVTIESGVQTIGREAFSSCTGLASVDLGSSIQTIGSSVFYNCSDLAQISVKAESAPIITAETFRGIKENGTLTVPSGKKEVYAYWMKTESYYLGYLNWTIQEADE